MTRTPTIHQPTKTIEEILATITGRRVHRDFAAMLRKETIKDCLPNNRDPHDLQRAVNVYHLFRNETCKFIARKHGVVSLRFEHEEPVPPQRTVPCTHDNTGEYIRNSYLMLDI